MKYFENSIQWRKKSFGSAITLRPRGGPKRESKRARIRFALSTLESVAAALFEHRLRLREITDVSGRKRSDRNSTVARNTTHYVFLPRA
jgi:hypothetical protein